MNLKNLSYAIILSITSATAYAETPGAYYMGVKAGGYTFDDSGIDGSTTINVQDFDITANVDVEGESAYGIQFGYQLTPTLSVEAEYLQGDIDLDIAIDLTAVPEILGGGQVVRETESFDLESFGVYGAYRSQGDFYVLGKLGFANLRFEDDDSDTKIAGSLGVGYRFTDSFSIEAEYNRLDSEFDFTGVSARFSF